MAFFCQGKLVFVPWRPPNHHSPLKRSLKGLAQDLVEGSAEVLVKDGVDDRVEGAVAVANPEEELEERVRDLARLPADSVQTVAEEKWEPADHKHAHDHSQDKGEALLTGL